MAERQVSAARRPDAVDRALLALLLRDARMSVRAIAEHLHISRANAYARLSRLTEEGVIRGYTARIDHEKVGQGTSAYLTLKIVQNSWRRVREVLLRMPSIEHMALVSGDFDVLLLVRAADTRQLRELVLTELQKLPEVLSTRTLLVFDETDRQPALPPEDRRH